MNLCKTIVGRQSDRYAAFPTFTHDAQHIYLFYRQGQRGDPCTHGRKGRVIRRVIDKSVFLKAFREGSETDLTVMGEERVLFDQDNEMDAIVSKLNDNTWALATRTFSPPDNRMTTYFSLASQPDFNQRHPVRVPGVKWLVFFGKGFAWQGDWVFPAYGGLDEDTLYRPLLLATRDGISWRCLAYLPSPIDGVGLNECSVAELNGVWHMFMRCDHKQFGIWHATSSDLVTWSKSRQLFSAAQAPMALAVDGRILLTYRRIIGEDSAASSLLDPFDGESIDLETYAGNIYDGGYTDPGMVDGKLCIFYYQGNDVGEPFIRCCINS